MLSVTVDGLGGNDGVESRKHGTVGSAACTMNRETNVSVRNIYVIVGVLLTEGNLAEPALV